MKISDFQNEVARRADTANTKINVAETKRVLGQAFAVLAELPVEDAFDLVSKSINAAAKRRAPAQDGRVKRV